MIDNPSKRTHRIKTMASTSLYQHKPVGLILNNRVQPASLRSRISQVDSIITRQKRTARIFNSFNSHTPMKRSLSIIKYEQLALKPLVYQIIGQCNNEKLVSKLIEERDRWARKQSKSSGEVKFIWGYVTSLTLTRLKDSVVMSRIPGSRQMTQKGNLYQNVSSYCQKQELDLNFLPITFSLNREGPTHTLKSTIKDFLQFFTYVKQNTNLSNTWIMKPTNMNQGRDIHLFDSLPALSQILNHHKLKDLESFVGGDIKSLLSYDKIIEEYVTNNRSLILQKYIENPMLIRNHKFDIRIWVLIDHLKGYLRFSSQPYKLCSKTINDQYMHLTNHALQKHSPNYQTSQCIQPISVLKTELKEKGKERFFDLIDNKIKQIIDITVRACIPSTRVQKHKTFQIFGFDFLIDREHNVRLIEVNCNPAITEDNELLSELIPKMLNDALKLTIDKIFNTRSSKLYHIERLTPQNGWQLLGNLKCN